MNITLDSLPGMELILPIIVDSLDIKSICQLRLTCNRFARLLVRGGSTYRNCLLEEIIFDLNFMSKKLSKGTSLAYWSDQ